MSGPTGHAITFSEYRSGCTFAGQKLTRVSEYLLEDEQAGRGRHDVIRHRRSDTYVRVK